MTEEKGGSLTGRALWLLFARTLAFAFSFALPLLLARRLDQEEFGLYKQAFLVIGTAVVVLPLGFAMSAFYYLPREGAEGRRRVVFNILLFHALVGAAACLALFLRPGLLAPISEGDELVRLAPLIGVVVMLWVVSSYLEYVAIANQEPKLATAFIVAAQLSKTALLLGAALLGVGVRPLVYAAAVQGALQTAALVAYLNSRFPGFWRGFEWGMLRRQFSYALPLGLAGMLYTAQLDLHYYVVSARFDQAAFAVYAVGCFQLPLVAILSDAVGSVMIPRVSQLQSRGEHREVLLVTARAMRKLAAVFFPLYALLLVSGREFITGLYTELYAESVPIFWVNLTLLPFSIFVLDPVMRAYAEHRYFLLKVRPALLALLFAALWYGTGRYGLLAAVAAMVGVTIAERLVMAWKVGRILGATRRDAALFADVGKLAAAAAAAGLVTALVRAALASAGHPLAVLAACAACYAAAYAAFVHLLDVPTPEERRTLRDRLGSLPRRAFFRKRPANPLA